ncbi:MAG: YfcE family phosphodiesterase [Gemmatimonadaceae bacterium]|nr:YfcE family phosphodiesterase [Gemmatimonadaceae bacterium]
MLVGLLSDTHDRLPAIRSLLEYMQKRGVGIVLHAGDFCAPFSLRPFIELNMPMVGVFGRNDGDHEGIRAFAQQGMGLELFESPHSFEMGGQRILLVHDLADASPRSVESHGVVVHGFTHREEMMIRGETLIVNPGEGCGWLHGEPGGAILDTATKEVHFFKLKDVHTFEASNDA